MTFYREGKKCNYYEVIETLSTLVNKEILNNLNEEEVDRFFIRIMNFTKEIISEYLQKLDYRVVNLKQSFLTLEQLKMVTQYEIWEQAIKFEEEIKAEKPRQKNLIEFMSKSLLEAMKELDMNLKKWPTQ